MIQVRLPNETRSKAESIVFKTGLREAPEFHVRLKIMTVAALETSPKESPVLKVSQEQGGTIRFDAIAHEPIGMQAVPIVAECLDRTIKTETKELERNEVDGVRKVRTLVQVFIPPCSADEAPSEGKSVVRVRHRSDVLDHEIQWRRVWPIVASPHRVFMHADTLGNTERIVRLRALRPFKVTAASASPEYLRVVAGMNSYASVHEIHVLCGSARDEQKAGAGTIRIRTDHPRQAELQIPVHIIWRKTGD